MYFWSPKSGSELSYMQANMIINLNCFRPTECIYSLYIPPKAAGWALCAAHKRNLFTIPDNFRNFKVIFRFFKPVLRFKGLLLPTCSLLKDRWKPGKTLSRFKIL